VNIGAARRVRSGSSGYRRTMTTDATQPDQPGGYDPDRDPDSDPHMLTDKAERQPSQAEGEDESDE
jgi:hypothetical protein